MGYYTRFEVSISENQSEIIEHLIEENICEFGYIFDNDGDSHDCFKWYDHETDMKEISKLYPDVLFTLKGEGEEAGDLWFKYFKNGKIQRCPAIITYDPFDEAKMK